MRRRRGTSLIELLVVFTAVTAILTLTVQIMHRMMQSHSQARSFNDVERHALRLSQQFRYDVHQASSARLELKGEEQHLVLARSEKPAIEYRVAQGRVARTVALVDGGTIRDEFRFPPETAAEIVEHASPPRIGLTLRTHAELVPRSSELRRSPLFVTPVCVHIEAALGRQRHLLRDSTDEESP